MIKVTPLPIAHMSVTQNVPDTDIQKYQTKYESKCRWFQTFLNQQVRIPNSFQVEIKMRLELFGDETPIIRKSGADYEHLDIDYKNELERVINDDRELIELILNWNTDVLMTGTTLNICKDLHVLRSGGAYDVVRNTRPVNSLGFDSMAKALHLAIHTLLTNEEYNESPLIPRLRNLTNPVSIK